MKQFQDRRHLSAILLLALAACGPQLACGRCLFAQRGLPAAPGAAGDPAALPDAPAAESVAATLFPHPESSRYLIAGETNIIFQGDPGFHSPYEGPNSFIGRAEYKTSLLGTLYLGYQLRRAPRNGTEFLFDLESTGGRGLSEALGLAGATNLDVVRNPNLSYVPYVARVQLHQTIGLGNKTIASERSPINLATAVPERRIELRFGKMTLPDLFDVNSVGSDSHLQFMNWTIDNSGAWDYAADTRGYTYAATAEYDDRLFSVRYAVGLMPTVANGIDLDWNLRRASGQNGEFELRKPLFKANRATAVRVLGYVNHAHMGRYRDAVNAFLEGKTPTPDIIAVEKYGAVKYGFNLNAEQEITPNLRGFLRVGWNEGQHESFAYTEVDQTVEFGGDYSLRSGLLGLPPRPLDKIGLAFVTNAIKHDHQEYLKLGGLGFLLGDGNLNYAREDILEGYYNYHAWRGVYYAFDTQFIEHPGYNQDRGPVEVFSVRMHVDF
ncbi:MAG TPA: carbohydrate porin [Granulicella sp.]|jgi:high affinity Mn2+ porin|nr:carbohydrate porin [Granulicella sp.]